MNKHLEIESRHTHNCYVCRYCGGELVGKKVWHADCCPLKQRTHYRFLVWLLIAILLAALCISKARSDDNYKWMVRTNNVVTISTNFPPNYIEVQMGSHLVSIYDPRFRVETDLIPTITLSGKYYTITFKEPKK